MARFAAGSFTVSLSISCLWKLKCWVSLIPGTDTLNTHMTSSILAGGQSLRVASPAVWMATKLQAFLDRGKDDLISSQDLEDVVILVDGRPELSKEIEGADADVRAFIVSVFRSLLVEEELRVAVQAHLPPDEASRARAAVILSRIEEIAELS